MIAEQGTRSYLQRFIVANKDYISPKDLALLNKMKTATQLKNWVDLQEQKIALKKKKMQEGLKKEVDEMIFNIQELMSEMKSRFSARIEFIDSEFGSLFFIELMEKTYSNNQSLQEVKEALQEHSDVVKAQDLGEHVNNLYIQFKNARR